MKNFKLASAASSMAMITALTCAPAYAQSDDEIIVTAQRREQSLQSVPIAVTAIDGDMLEEIGAVDITAIQRMTPNATIEVARGSNSTLIAFIRGVGQQDPLWGFEPGVGIYVDDVYVARPQGAVLDIFDVERVEVLRGPQGTLYGRNTIGGAIKYVTKSLDMESPMLEGQINVGNYGQFDQILKGSIPIGDRVAIGGAIANLNRDGFGENLYSGADHYNKDVLAMRVSAEVQATDTFNLRLAYDRTVDDSNAKHGHRLVPSADGTLPVTSNVFDTRAGLGTENQVKTQGVSLTASLDVNDYATFKSITAYRDGETVTPIDFDTLPQQAFDVPAVYADDQFSQEFQLVYAKDKLSGVVGLYFLDGQANGEFDLVLRDLGLTIYQAGDQKKKNVSLYADFTYDLNDQLSLSAGARYSKDKTVADVTRDLWLGLGSGSFDPSNTSSIFFATQTGYQGLGRDDEAFTPRLALSYKANDDLNLYASYSRGFKAGGFDPRARADLDPLGLSREGFGPEYVDSFELGAKGNFFDNRLTLNAAAFFAKYDDQQITVQSSADSDNDGTNDTFVSSVFNAGKSEYKGLELEALLRITDNLSATGVLGYIDAEIKEILTADPLNPNGTINIADQFVTQNTPELTWRLGLNYTTGISDMGTVSLNGALSYRDAYHLFNVPLPGFSNTTYPNLPYTAPALDPESYMLVDLGAKWTAPNGKYWLSVNGRNLGNEEYHVAAYSFPNLGVDGAYSAFYGAPRTVTASLGIKFK